MLGTREYTLCSPFRANAHILVVFVILLLTANMLVHSYLLRLVIYVGSFTMFSGVSCVMRSCSFHFVFPCVSIFSTCAFLIILFTLCFIWSLLRLLIVSWSSLYFCIMACMCLFQGVFYPLPCFLLVHLGLL